MSSCRIISVKGDQVHCEITLDDGNGLRAVIPAWFTAVKADGEWGIKTDWHSFDRLPPTVHLTFGEPVIFADPKKLCKDAESEIESMLWGDRFKMPGDFVKVEAVME